MKNLCLGLLVFFWSLCSFAYFVEVLGIKKTDRDYVFNLPNDTKRTKVTLDCSSFFHNLSVKDPKHSFTYYMSANECWSAYDFLNVLPGGKGCLEYESNSYNLTDC